MAQIFFNGLHIINGTAAEAFTRFRIQDEVISGTLISAGTVYTLTAEEGSFAANLHGAAIGVTTPDLFPVDFKVQVGRSRFKEVEGNKWQSGNIRFAGSAEMLLPLAYILPADEGAFVLTAASAAMGKLSGPETRNKFITATGSFDPGEDGESFLTAEFSAWSPELVVEAVVFTMPADTGAFVLSGVDVALTQQAMISAEIGAFTLSGQAAQTLHHSILPAETGVFISTFLDATLAHQIIFVMVADTGAFASTFVAAPLIKVSVVQADPGSFILTGDSTGLLASRLLLAETGAFNATFSDAELILTRFYTMAAETGSFVFAASNSTLSKNVTMVAESGNFNLTGNSALLSSNIARLPDILGRVTVISFNQKPRVAA